MGWRDKLKPMVGKAREKAKDPEFQRQVREGAQKAAAAHKRRQARPHSVPPRGVSRGGVTPLPYDDDHDDDRDNDGVDDDVELAQNEVVADDQFEEDVLAEEEQGDDWSDYGDDGAYEDGE